MQPKIKDRVGRLLLMHANKREEITEASAGEIVAAVGSICNHG